MAVSHVLLPILALVALAGCGKADGDVDALDRELLGNVAEQADPALTTALEDQIVVDPALTASKAGEGARATDRPKPPGPSAAECYAGLAYGDDWATKLPSGVPLPRDAIVDEAAGNDQPGCGTRVVSYATAGAPADLVSFYLAEARRAGWAADRARRHGDEVVAGERAGAAFYVAITPRRRGATVSIVTSG